LRLLYQFKIMERGCVNHGYVIKFDHAVHRQSTTPLRAVIESTVKSASKLESPFLTANRILRYTIQFDG